MDDGKIDDDIDCCMVVRLAARRWRPPCHANPDTRCSHPIPPKLAHDPSNDTNILLYSTVLSLSLMLDSVSTKDNVAQSVSSCLILISEIVQVTRRSTR